MSKRREFKQLIKRVGRVAAREALAVVSEKAKEVAKVAKPAKVKQFKKDTDDEKEAA